MNDMKNTKYKIIAIIAILTVTVSCDDVLDVTPDNRTFIDSPEKIGELLVGAYPDAAYVPFLEPMSDNAGDKSANANTSYSDGERINQEMFFWRDISDTNIDTPTNYWNRAYKAVAQANQALLSIEEQGGGEELDYLRGEALLCRAYAHFMLVSIYSEAYDPNTAETLLGVPYVTEPEDVLLGEYERGTIADVYANIKADLEEGLLLVDDNYDQPKYHFTREAANAFASRFYLNLGEWDKVITHSSVVVGDSPLFVIRNWEGNYRTSTYSEQAALYKSTVEPANLLLVSANSAYDRYHANARYQLNLDLASELFFSGNPTGGSWSISVFGSSDLFYNIPKVSEYFKVINQAAGTGEVYVTYVLFSTDEALLNRAEAYAMKGELDAAAADLNTVLSVNTRDYDPSTDVLTASDFDFSYGPVDPDLYTPYYTIPDTSLSMIDAVLSIKRTIFYNDGLRWFDIKRHNMSVAHRDVLGNEYFLTKDDKRKALQIPEAAKSLGIEINAR